MRQFLRAGFLVTLLFFNPIANAEKPSAELQVKLQTAMLNYTDGILVDGGYSYLDTENDVMTTVYPANAHPFVVKFGEDYFVCSEFINDNGDTITADYLVRQIGENFKVVQMIINDRASLKSAMSKLGQ